MVFMKKVLLLQKESPPCTMHIMLRRIHEFICTSGTRLLLLRSAQGLTNLAGRSSQLDAQDTLEFAEKLLIGGRTASLEIRNLPLSDHSCLHRVLCSRLGALR